MEAKINQHLVSLGLTLHPCCLCSFGEGCGAASPTLVPKIIPKRGWWTEDKVFPQSLSTKVFPHQLLADVMGALFCGLLEIIWLSQSIFTWQMPPQEDLWPRLQHKMGSVVLKTPPYELLFINLGITPFREHDESSATLWTETFLPPSVLHRQALKSMEKEFIFQTYPPRHPLLQGNFFPITEKKPKKPKIKNLLIQGTNIQKHDAHLVQGWKSYFIFMSREGAITQGGKRRKKSSTGQGHSVTDLDGAQGKPNCNKNENKQPWGGSADAWKSIRKRKEIIRS